MIISCGSPEKSKIDCNVWTNGSNDSLVVREDYSGAVLLCNRSSTKFTFSHLPGDKIEIKIPEHIDLISLSKNRLQIFDVRSGLKLIESKNSTIEDLKNIGIEIKNAPFNQPIKEIVDNYYSKKSEGVREL